MFLFTSFIPQETLLGVVLKVIITGSAARDLTYKINNNGTVIRRSWYQCCLPITLPPLACSCQCAVTLLTLLFLSCPLKAAGKRVNRLNVSLFTKNDIKTSMLLLLLQFRRHLLTRCYTSYKWPVYKRSLLPALSFRIKTTFRSSLNLACHLRPRVKIQNYSIEIR